MFIRWTTVFQPILSDGRAKNSYKFVDKISTDLNLQLSTICMVNTNRGIIKVPMLGYAPVTQSIRIGDVIFRKLIFIYRFVPPKNAVRQSLSWKI